MHKNITRLLLLVFVLIPSLLAQNCPEGQYYDSGSGQCNYCDATCSTCTGPSSTECTACIVGNLFEGECFPSCDTSLYFNTKTKSCDVCSPSCFQCNGPTAQDCTDCVPPSFLKDGVCACEAGQYFDGTIGLCQQCNIFCDECDGPTATQCKTCKNNMILTNGQCDCPAGSAMDMNTLKCFPCEDGCLQCSKYYPPICSACKNNLILTGGVCGCPASQYLNTQTMSCEQCHSTCATCDDAADKCLTCPPGLILTAQKTCECPEKTFYNQGTQTCQPCAAGCQTCSGPLANNCLTCTGGRELINGRCNCPEGTFLDPNSNTCKDCDPTCRSCSGSGEDQCIACKGSLIMLDNNQCGCPDGKYLNGEKTECLNCDSDCNTCFGAGPNRCLSCNGNQRLVGGSCVCLTGTYLNPNTNRCEDCYSTCSECTGPLEDDCEDCKGNLILIDGVCECNNGFYLDLENIRCVECDSTCESCTSGSATACIACKNNLQKINNRCQCPEGRFLNTQNTRCETCYNLCETCSGAGSDQCTSCKNNLVLLDDNSCGCNEGTFLDLSTDTCKPCYGACETCSGPLESNCLTCKQGLNIAKDNTCECNDGTYLDTENFTCEACDSSCDQCSGPSSSQCLSCKEGFTFTSQNTCVCPTKTYLDTSSFTCSPCHTLCDFCSGPSQTDCLSCPPGQILLDDNSCGCAGGTYLDPESSKCLACSNACGQCSGPSENECLSCSNNLILNEKGVCGCGPAQYLNKTVMHCEPCAGFCNGCSGPLLNECTSCRVGWTLIGTVCLQNCDEGQYNAKDGSCAQCEQSCLECSGPLNTDCTSCPVGKILTEDGQCLEDKNKEDNDNKEDDDNEETPGKGPLCAKGLFYVEGQGICLSECPSLYYIKEIDSQQVCAFKQVFDNRALSTKNLTTYKVNFNNSISNIYSDLERRISVSILFVSPKQVPIEYSYILSLSDDGKSIHIMMNFKGHLLPYNALLIDFDIDDDDKATPYTIVNKQLTLTLYEYYPYSANTIENSETSGNVQNIGQTANNVMTYGSSFLLQSIHSIRSELMESMISYFLYMNIAYPPNFISYALIGLDASDLFLPNMWQPPLESLETMEGGSNRRLDQSTKKNLRETLGDIRFLSNVGTSVTLLVVVIGAIILFEVFVLVLHKKKLEKSIFYKIVLYISFCLRWSYLMNEFISEYQGLSFCSLATLVLTKNFTPDAIFDYVFAILFFITSILTIVGIFLLLRWIYKGLKESEAESDDDNSLNKKTSLRRLNILHKEYNKRSFIQLLYPFCLVLRCFGFSFVLVFLQSSAILQTLFLIIATIAIIVFLFKFRPMTRLSQHILTLIYEFIFLFVSIIALTLHLYNQNHIEDIDTRTNLAFVIVGGALTMMAFNFVSMTFELIELRKYLSKYWKKSVPVAPLPSALEDNKGALEEDGQSSSYGQNYSHQLTSVSSHTKQPLTQTSSFDEEKPKLSKYMRLDSRFSMSEDGRQTEETLNTIGNEVKDGSDNQNPLFRKYTLKEVKNQITEDPEESMNEVPYEFKKRNTPNSPLQLKENEESGGFEPSVSKLGSSMKSGMDMTNSFMMNTSGMMPLMKRMSINQNKELETELEELEDKKIPQDKVKGHRRNPGTLGFGWVFGNNTDKKKKKTMAKSRKIMPIFEGSDWSSDLEGTRSRTIQGKDSSNNGQEKEKESEIVRTVVSARGEKKSLPWNLPDFRGMMSARNHYDVMKTLVTEESENKNLLMVPEEDNLEVVNYTEEAKEEESPEKEEQKMTTKKHIIRKALNTHIANFKEKMQEGLTSDEEKMTAFEKKKEKRSRPMGNRQSKHSIDDSEFGGHEPESKEQG